MDLGISGKVALITGGATGIGREIARSFAREGVRVAICGRTQSTLDEAVRGLEQETGGEVFGVCADVLTPGDLERFVSATVERFDGADIVINNADFMRTNESFFEVDEDDLLEKFRLKLIAPIRLIQLAAPYMQKNGWGRVVSIGGGAARIVSDSAWAKGATHPGMINVSKKLASVLGRDGITVNVVEPGGVWTDGKTWGGRSRTEVRQEALRKAAEKEGVSYEELEAREARSLVIGRRIQVEDIADLVLFLSSNRAGAITGETIIIDGGENPIVRF